MKTCPNCNIAVEDNALFCGNCGAKLGAEPQQPSAGPQPVYTPPVDPYDHTAEFDPKDISDNKVIAMLIYLMGVVGIIIALLLSNSSKYVAFHVRQALKITVITILGGIVAALLCWTVIVPLAFGVLSIAIFVIKIICFFQICKGKAIEPAIIRDFAFLR